MSEFLKFELLRDTGKTKFFAVNSKRHGGQLALIRWYGPWRQYVVQPGPETIWNAGCLEQVIAFMDELMAERRSKPRT